MRKAVLAVANREPIYAEIDRITVPTLVIVGADDVPTPVEKARRIAARIPGARLEIVPDAGHSSTVEQPEAITKLLRDFLLCGLTGSRLRFAPRTARRRPAQVHWLAVPASLRGAKEAVPGR